MNKKGKQGMPVSNNTVPKLFGLSTSEEEPLRSMKKSMEISDDRFTYMSLEEGATEKQDFDLHLDLENFSDNDASDDEDWAAQSSDSDEELKNLGQWKASDNSNTNYSGQNNGSNADQDGEDIAVQGALLPYDDGIDVSSDEEKEIMKEIKDEIKNMVRGEMKSELDYYEKKTKALEQGDTKTHKDSNKFAEEENNDLLEPKIKEAIIKMRKLDRILAKRVKREKQVKRDRIILEKRIKDEIDELKPEGKERKDEQTNTMKYLSLTLPPSHNEGVELPPLSSEPVFTTQLNEKDYPDINKQNKKGTPASRNRGSSQRSRGSSDRSESQQDTTSEIGSESSSAPGSQKSKKKKKKNFIKRNIELAAESENLIPMTDEEKHRLDELLVDMDNLSEIPEENASSMDGDYNPFQMAIRPGEGFCPDPDDQRSLSNIDSRLRNILPPEEYESLASVTPSYTPQHKLFTTVGIDYERFGEKALLENKEQRDLRSRLQGIEDELAQLYSSHELEISETPRLEEEDLKDLLDQCVRSMSHSTLAESESAMSTEGDEETPTPRTPNSAREKLMENPPRLSQATLQKLLSEAYCPAASRLSTLREEEEEEGEVVEPISAETWKVIAQEKLEGEEEENNRINSLRASLRSSRNSMRFSSSISDGSTLKGSGRNSTDRTDSSFDSNYSRNESRESKTPFLPEINRSGSLVAQDFNNPVFHRPSSNNSIKSSVITSRNSLTDVSSDFQDYEDGTELLSVNGDTPVPAPPTGEKRTNSSQSNKSRVITPVNKSLS